MFLAKPPQAHHDLILERNNSPTDFYFGSGQLCGGMENSADVFFSHCSFLILFVCGKDQVDFRDGFSMPLQMCVFFHHFISSDSSVSP